MGNPVLARPGRVSCLPEDFALRYGANNGADAIGSAAGGIIAQPRSGATSARLTARSLFHMALVGSSAASRSSILRLSSAYRAFAADREPTDLTIARVLNDFVPLSRLTNEHLNGLRQWAKDSARMAVSTSPSETRLWKIAA